jgi:cytochrome c oxidase subunit 3
MTNFFTGNFNLNDSKSKAQFFPSHLVENSLWPLMLSLSLFALAISAVLSMHGYAHGSKLFACALVLTIAGMLNWWQDVIAEAVYKGHHTKKVIAGILQAFNLFILSEVMVFLSVFWAYAHSSLSPAVEIGGVWPPYGITALDAFGLPFLNTLLLLSSGAFITYAHHSLIANQRYGLVSGIIFTVLMASVFTSFQYLEYIDAGFSFADSAYGSAFYATTGLHGTHVIVGTIFIFIQFIRLLKSQLTTGHHLGLELSILYWHFVDIIWLFLFAMVYYWGGGSSA